jgi:serine/threonine protein kinase
MSTRKKESTSTKKKSGALRFRFSKVSGFSGALDHTAAIKVLHDIQILHRDLKSANVFLCKDNTVKIGDMNVSKIAKKGLLYT